MQEPACTATRRSVVAVVGAGAAGTLSAIHLAREAARTATHIEVVLVDPAAEVGRGVAYSTEHPSHLLNAPAQGMSAFVDDPDHFLRWLRRRVAGHAAATDFAARRDYAGYLAETLDEELASAGCAVTMRRVHERAVRYDGRTPDGGTPDGSTPDGSTVVELAGGSRLEAQAVVLALGVFAPSVGWAPESLRASDRFVADPWAAGALDAAREEDSDVLLVGSGLTMVDVALGLGAPDRVLHAISRRGLMPRAHRRLPLAPREPRRLPPAPTLDALRALIRAHVEETVVAVGDWRPAVDGLRAHVPELWAGLSGAEQAEFLATDAALWEVHRHRMAPGVARAVGKLRSAGALQVSADEVLACEPDGDRILVTLASGRKLTVGWVVNCTGPQRDVRDLGDPLVDSLLDAGVVKPGPLGIGFGTLDGRVLAADSSVQAPVWVLGALRKGELWETTAVPEIRLQAARLAADVSEAVGSSAGSAQAKLPSRSSRRPVDPMGLPLSTSSAAAAAYNRGVDKVMRVQSGAVDDFAEAVTLDPGFAMGHAALVLLGHEAGADVDVDATLEAAQHAVRLRGDERERSLVEVLTRRVADLGGAGAEALVRHIAEHPLDAMAVSAAVPTIAFSGVTDIQQEAWALVEGLAPAYGSDWWYAGLLAFVRQDQGRYDEAEALAVRGLEAEPASGHAVHARTHVFYETGQHVEGLRWLDAWVAASGPKASHLAHFAWHAALHELALDDGDAVVRRYAAQLAPPMVTGVRGLVDSASLLWRASLAGAWPGQVPVGDVLERVPASLLQQPDTPFVALHSAVALTAAGDVTGLARLRRHAQLGSPVMREVVAPLCEAMIAVVEHRWDAAALLLRPLLPSLVRVGGSAAQREVVEETLLFVLVSGGAYAEARRFLDARLDRRPSPLDTRRWTAAWRSAVSSSLVG